jgi:hypothetical protein
VKRKRKSRSTLCRKEEANPLISPVTTLPKHLELFAQAIADGCNVREASKRCGRKEGSGGYLNSRPDVIQRIAEIRAATATALQNDTAERMVALGRKLDIDGGEIIMGLATIARDVAMPPSARVSAYHELVEIFHLKTSDPRRIREFIGWANEEMDRYGNTGEVPKRFRAFVGESLDLPQSQKRQENIIGR